MLRTLIVTVVMLSGAFMLTSNHIGYNKAGSDYVSKIRNERKSVRAGSGYYTPVSRGTGSFRSGK